MDSRLTSQQFPLLLSYHGSAELEYIADPAALAHIIYSHLLPDSDRLIDCHGQIYTLSAAGHWQSTAEYLQLHEIIALIQQHFFACAQSCVVKIQAPDIRSAFALLAAES